MLDDEWLRNETSGELSKAALERVQRAAETPGVDNEPASKPELAEYWRLRRAAHAPCDTGQVRGRHASLWIEHIDHMKRRGRLEQALQLAYECLDSVDRERLEGGLDTRASWTERAAIILRKMKDYDSEARLLESQIAAGVYPARLGQRLDKALDLASRQAP